MYTYVFVKLYSVTPNHNVPNSNNKYSRLLSRSQFSGVIWSVAIVEVTFITEVTVVEMFEFKRLFTEEFKLSADTDSWLHAGML